MALIASVRTSAALTSRQGQSEVFGPVRLKHSGRCASCDRAWISGPGRPPVISRTSLSCWAAPALFRPEARELKVPSSPVPALDRSRHCHRAGAGLLDGATLTWRCRQDVSSMLNTVRPVRQVCLRNRTCAGIERIGLHYCSPEAHIDSRHPTGIVALARARQAV